MTDNRPMSVAEHHRDAPHSVPCVVLTVSDTRTPETDTGGRAIVDLLVEGGHSVLAHQIVRDDPADVARLVGDAIARGEARAILTTGGTGIASRDMTLEAISALFDKRIEGFGELFRALSFEDVGPAAMLSRAAAGTAGRTAIFLLPGSEAAVRLALTRLILPELGHIVRELDR